MAGEGIIEGATEMTVRLLILFLQRLRRHHHRRHLHPTDERSRRNDDVVIKAGTAPITTTTTTTTTTASLRGMRREEHIGNDDDDDVGERKTRRGDHRYHPLRRHDNEQRSIRRHRSGGGANQEQGANDPTRIPRTAIMYTRGDRSGHGTEEVDTRYQRGNRAHGVEGGTRSYESRSDVGGRYRIRQGHHEGRGRHNDLKTSTRR